MRLILRSMCIALLAAAGCSREATGPEWEGAEYQYDFQRTCYCPRELVQPVTIVVSRGEVVRVLTRPGWADVTNTPGAKWPTIIDLHREIAEARGRGERVIVRYHERLGYPTYIEIGTIANDAGVVYTADNMRYGPMER